MLPLTLPGPAATRPEFDFSGIACLGGIGAMTKGAVSLQEAEAPQGEGIFSQLLLSVPGKGPGQASALPQGNLAGSPEVKPEVNPEVRTQGDSERKSAGRMEDAQGLLAGFLRLAPVAQLPAAAAPAAIPEAPTGGSEDAPAGITDTSDPSDPKATFPAPQSGIAPGPGLATLLASGQATLLAVEDPAVPGSKPNKTESCPTGQALTAPQAAQGSVLSLVGTPAPASVRTAAGPSGMGALPGEAPPAKVGNEAPQGMPQPVQQPVLQTPLQPAPQQAIQTPLPPAAELTLQPAPTAVAEIAQVLTVEAAGPNAKQAPEAITRSSVPEAAQVLDLRARQIVRQAEDSGKGLHPYLNKAAKILVVKEETSNSPVLPSPDSVPAREVPIVSQEAALPIPSLPQPAGPVKIPVMVPKAHQAVPEAAPDARQGPEPNAALPAEAEPADVATASRPVEIQMYSRIQAGGTGPEVINHAQLQKPAKPVDTEADPNPVAAESAAGVAAATGSEELVPRTDPAAGSGGARAAADPGPTRNPILRQVAQKLDLGGPDQKLTIRLQPGSLGTVDVEFTTQGGKLSVHLTASSAQAQSALRENIQELTESIRDKGGRFQHVDIRVEVRENLETKTEGRGEDRREQPRDESRQENQSQERKRGQGDRDRRGPAHETRFYGKQAQMEDPE